MVLILILTTKKIMQIIDLTHSIENGMPAYPGEESPTVEKKLSHDRDGVQVIRFTSLTHSGTHLDMPSHFFANTPTTDNANMEQFYGKGCVVDCSMFGKNETIPAQHLIQYDNEIRNAEFVLIYTGYDRYWGSHAYFDQFPVLSIEAVEYLSDFQLKGIGFDVASIDPIDSNDYPNHNLVLRRNLIIIENLTNLQSLTGKKFELAAFPLKIKEGDGSPVRAVGIVRD